MIETYVLQGYDMNSLQCKNVGIDNEIDFVVCQGEPKNRLDNPFFLLLVPRLRDSSEAEVHLDLEDFNFLSISF